MNKISKQLREIKVFLLFFFLIYLFFTFFLVNVQARDSTETIFTERDTTGTTSTQQNIILNQLTGLNILQNICIYPGFPDQSCTFDNSILLTIWAFLVRIAAVIGGLVFIYAGYLTMIDKYEEAKKIIYSVIQGVFAVLLVNTVVKLALDSFFPKAGVSQSDCSGQFVQSNIFGDYCINLNINPIVDFIIVLINNLLLPAAVIVAALFFLAGLYNLLFSGGNANKVEIGWKYMKNSVFGLVAGLLSYTVINLVYSFLLIFFN